MYERKKILKFMKIHRWKIKRGREFLKLTIYILNASIIYIYIYKNVKYIFFRFFKTELNNTHRVEFDYAIKIFGTIITKILYKTFITCELLLTYFLLLFFIFI